MVNARESLINVVTNDQPKVLRGWGQTGTWSGLGAPNSPSADGVPPAERRDLTHTGTHGERGKPVVLPTGAIVPDGTANRKGSRGGCGYGIVEEAKADL